METTARTPGTRDFAPISKRWTVERTCGWLMLHRHLARDHEAPPARSEAMIHLAMTDLMARRLTGETARSVRATMCNHVAGESAVTLRFVGIDPNAGGGGSPTVWVEEESADLVL